MPKKVEMNEAVKKLCEYVLENPFKEMQNLYLSEIAAVLDVSTFIASKVRAYITINKITRKKCEELLKKA